jgi:hypothetical protein
MVCVTENVLETVNNQVGDVALPDRVNKIEENVGAIGKELRALKASVDSVVQRTAQSANVMLPTAAPATRHSKWKSPGIWGSIGSCVALPLAVIMPLSLRSCDKNDQNEANRIKLAVTAGIADSKLGDRMQGVEQRVSGVEASIRELNVFLPSLTREQWKRDSSVAPQGLQKEIPKIKALVAVSRRLDITSVPVADIATVGKRLLPLAEKSPEAWDTMLDVASYRSALNAPQKPSYPQQGLSSPGVTSWSYNLQHVDDRPRVALSFSSTFMLPEKQAAHLDFIGKDQNEKATAAPGWLFAKGGVASLDGMEIRNVVFDGVEVHYSGKLVMLERVMFVDCTFVFENNERGRELTAKVLEAFQVNFKPT